MFERLGIEYRESSDALCDLTQRANYHLATPTEDVCFSLDYCIFILTLYSTSLALHYSCQKESQDTFRSSLPWTQAIYFCSPLQALEALGRF